MFQHNNSDCKNDHILIGKLIAQFDMVAKFRYWHG